MCVYISWVRSTFTLVYLSTHLGLGVQYVYWSLFCEYVTCLNKLFGRRKTLCTCITFTFVTLRSDSTAAASLDFEGCLFLSFFQETSRPGSVFNVQTNVLLYRVRHRDTHCLTSKSRACLVFCTVLYASDMLKINALFSKRMKSLFNITFRRLAKRSSTHHAEMMAHLEQQTSETRTRPKFSKLSSNSITEG